MQGVYRLSLVHGDALATEQVVFRHACRVKGLFFCRCVVYPVLCPYPEGIGVVGVAFKEMCATEAGVGNEILAGLVIQANLDAVSRQARTRETAFEQGVTDIPHHGKGGVGEREAVAD